MDQINLKPTTWGPSGWVFIHYVTLSYPNNPSPETYKNFYNFFSNVQKILPCEMCRHHFKEWMDMNPLSEALTSQDELVKWAFNAHNRVNVMNGKKPMDWLEFTKTYYNATPPIIQCSKCKNNNKNYTGKVIGVFILVIFTIMATGGIVVFSKKKKR